MGAVKVMTDVGTREAVNHGGEKYQWHLRRTDKCLWTEPSGP